MTSLKGPKISFGIIVLNGEPFTRYTLRALYPFAHEIIVVEGAVPASRNVATADGHSRDGTLDVLRRIQTEEDPSGKIRVVRAEDLGHPDGFWTGEKDEQSQAYARLATGDYLWQVDIDEFYHPDDMEFVVSTLSTDPSITAVSFKQITFWGGLDYWVDGWYLRRGATYYHRVFKWQPGYSYVTHRPPTVLDSEGRDLREINWLTGQTLEGKGIRLYHYSLLLPKQVSEKCAYYAAAPWAERSGASEWAERVYLRLESPYRVHNVYEHPSWLERYGGVHPPQVVSMMADLQADPGRMALRDRADIERLLCSPRYRVGRLALKTAEPIDRMWHDWLRLTSRTARRARRALARLSNDA